MGSGRCERKKINLGSLLIFWVFSHSGIFEVVLVSPFGPWVAAARMRGKSEQWCCAVGRWKGVRMKEVSMA